MRDRAGPLPAQPYILVLWPTHIGRYAIKHSPSENARASERASKRTNERASEPAKPSDCKSFRDTLRTLSTPLTPPTVLEHGSVEATIFVSLSPSPSLSLSLSSPRESESFRPLSLSLSPSLLQHGTGEVGPLCGCVEPRPGSARRGRTSDPRMWMDGRWGGGERETARRRGSECARKTGRPVSKQSFASTPDSSSFFPLSLAGGRDDGRKMARGARRGCGNYDAFLFRSKETLFGGSQ